MSQGNVVGRAGGVVQLPSVPFPPQQVLDTEEGNLIIIGCDGEVVILDSATLEQIGEVGTPFPCSMTRGAIASGDLIGFWVDHELRVARMARLPLSAGIKNGVHRAEVRNHRESVLQAPPVAGAVWSHVLDAEPLALCVTDDALTFTLWKRGIYRTDLDSTEIWRVGELSWPDLENLPRAEEISTLVEMDDSVLAISRGGGWTSLDKEDGSILGTGLVDSPAALTLIRYNEKGGWLLASDKGHLMRMNGLADEPSTITIGAPASAAAWDDVEGCWRICGWREDLRWMDSELTRFERPELAVHVMRHGESWLVLDNQGNWSRFKE